MKKFFLTFAALFLFLPVALADDCAQQRVEVFVRDGCGFCAQEEAYLKTIDNDGLEINVLNIGDKDNYVLYNQITEKYELSKVTPITLVGNEIMIGFSKTTVMAIESNLQNHTSFYSFQKALDPTVCIDIFGQEKRCGAKHVIEDENCEINPLEHVPVPFFGEVDVSDYALPTLSVVLGFIDGFNPCAMWVLVAFLIALIQIGDRFKMFLTAGVFIIAEAVMYALILTVWLNTWNFVGLDKWVSLIVGVVAVGAGGFFLYEGFFSDGTCKVTNVKQRQKISQKIQKISREPITIGFFVGLIALAFSVNIIEFACSIGIPQTFTVILHNSDLALLEKIWYIALYIIFYIVDDLIVFGIALYSIEKIGITHKYARACNVLGGVLMLILGVLLIFAPELLSL